MASGVRWDYREIRIETVEEGSRRSMRMTHLPTLLAVEGVGEHVSRKQLRRVLATRLSALLLERMLTPPLPAKPHDP
jgi:hypothetical protein